jgi:hypothetical protein
LKIKCKRDRICSINIKDFLNWQQLGYPILMTHWNGLEIILLLERPQLFSFQKEARACLTCTFLKVHMLSSQNTVNLIQFNSQEVLYGVFLGPRFSSLLLSRTSPISFRYEHAQPTTTSLLDWALLWCSGACPTKRVSLISFTESVLTS